MASRGDLEALAQLFGIELSYHDIKGRHQVASDEALLAVLPHLGAELSGSNDVAHALAARRKQLEARVLEPVFVCWEGHHDISFALPTDRAGGRFLAVLTLESGEVLPFSGRIADAALLGTNNGVERRRLPLVRSLPLGYHHLELEIDGRTFRSLLIAAPERAFLPAGGKLWGVFAPTYAQWSANGTGMGTLSELERLVERTGQLGGKLVGTLPLMAAFLDEPFEPSPYAPVSRLFWNELFLDLDQLPELESPDVRALRNALTASPMAKAELAQPLVDYKKQMAMRRPLLDRAAEAAWQAGSITRTELERHEASNPRARDYARFRAATERHHVWHSWPERMKNGELRDEDFDAARYRYHLYVQLRAAQQLGRVSAKAKDLGGGLYLDLPLGVHPDGYDAWRHSADFLGGCSAGAPPDDLFAGGQDWGFRPLHPENIRTRGYDYVIACVRHQLSTAGALRIDHVMGLERIFCVPHGLGGKHGIYVHYKSEELYAILTLESQRHRVMVIGEDLGTVPDVVRNAMNRHALLRMYVMQFSSRHDPNWAIDPPPALSVASLNTHDTPSFTAFWERTDIDLRKQLGHVHEPEASQEREARTWLARHVTTFLRSRKLLADNEDSTQGALRAILSFLADSEAQLLLVNLEDLLGEAAPQNVPGTTHEVANWRRKMKSAIDALMSDPSVISALQDVERRRSGR